MKTAELTGPLLALWVARAAKHHVDEHSGVYDAREGIYLGHIGGSIQPFAPHEDWAQAGRIIEREKIAIIHRAEFSEPWQAIVDPVFAGGWEIYGSSKQNGDGNGPTPLIAAMHAFVASVYGADVTD